MKVARLVCLYIALGSAACFADTLFYGESTVSLGCIPLSCPEPMEYQQLFVGSAIAGSPIFLTSLTLYASVPDTPGSIGSTGDYTVSLSTTAAVPDGLDPVFANNIGADSKVIFNGPIDGLFSPAAKVFTGGLGSYVQTNSTITFPANNFYFDPALGNLLLTMKTPGGSPVFYVLTGSGYCHYFCEQPKDVSQYSFGSSGVAAYSNIQELDTLLTYTPAASAPAPEPSTFWMAALLGPTLALLRKLRR